MWDVLAPLLITGAAVVAIAWFLLARTANPLVFASPQEERLTREMARVVGCSLAQALPAVRHEIDIAPNQSDDTLVKRAAYHYRQDQPVKTCSTYQDKVRG